MFGCLGAFKLINVTHFFFAWVVAFSENVMTMCYFCFMYSLFLGIRNTVETATEQMKVFASMFGYIN